MTLINFRSDFDIALRLLDCDGNEIYWPDFDWKICLWTTSRQCGYTATRHADALVNCYNDNGRIHIVADAHGLQPGQLSVDVIIYRPDGTYSDGSQLLFNTYLPDIRLVPQADTIPAAVEATLTIPWHLIHDTEVYTEVLRKVADAMEAELGAGTPGAGTPGGGDTTAVATTAAPRLVSRRMMRTTAQPGYVYRVHPDPDNFHYVDVIVPRPKNRKVDTVSLDRVFPGGKFGVSPIRLNVSQSGMDGTYDRETNTVKWLDSENPNPIYIEFLMPLHGTDAIPYLYLTVSETGAIVPYTEIPAMSEYVCDFEIGKLVDGDPKLRGLHGRWAYATTSYGELLEVQRRMKKKRKEPLAQRPFKESDKDKTKWRKFERWKSCGVFRARRRTWRGYTSPWVYFSYYNLNSTRNAKIVRI